MGHHEVANLVELLCELQQEHSIVVSFVELILFRLAELEGLCSLQVPRVLYIVIYYVNNNHIIFNYLHNIWISDTGKKNFIYALSAELKLCYEKM